MKTILFPSILFLLAATVCAQQTANLITPTSFDQIKKNTTLAELKKLYGSKNVKDDLEYAPEGLDSFKVSKIFKDTQKEIIVQWKKNKLYKQVDMVYTYQKGSPYKTADGLKVGSTLDQLVRVNGKRISFSGFSWDYGGMISSFGKGKLDKSNIYFDLGTEDLLPDGLLGEVELHSDMPLVKKNFKKIFVTRISVVFN
jgi:hypothetical protein